MKINIRRNAALLIAPHKDSAVNSKTKFPNMRIRQKQLIKMLSFPDTLTSQIVQINEQLVEAVNSGSYSIEEGTVDLGPLPEPLRAPYFLLIWFAQLNDVLHNLNLTLVDIEALRLNHVILSESPRQRFYLLLRTFFYEFYRAREIFNTGIKGLAKHNLIGHSEVQVARQQFHETFEPAIKIRNLLVHSTLNWPGKANFDLNHIGGALEQGFAIQKVGSGEIIDIAEVLQEVSDEYVPMLIEESNRLCAVLQAIMEICSQSYLATQPERGSTP